jgi:hypothetical protein
MALKETFFSKKHVYTAIWSIFIALLGFIGGLIYQNINGPQKVTIDSDATRTKPLYVQIRNSSECEVTSQSDAGDVKKELRSLRNSIEDVKLYSKYIGGNDRPFNALKTNAFILPHNVKGYYSVPLLGIAQANCVPQNLRNGEPLIIGFYLRDKTIINKSTPLFVRVILKKSDSQLVQIFEQQYEMKEGQNNILADVNLEAGKYEITYGYYLLNEMTREYPNYYCKVCSINIQK